MSRVENLVFVPGWGFNAEVWSDFADRIACLRPELRLHLIDLPGYGTAHTVTSQTDLSALASYCIDQVPERAVWVGWSLGGMVAMQAATSARGQCVQGLQLIATSAKFLSDIDYDDGVDRNVFDRFRDELSDDYQRAIKRFLLLQSGTKHETRGLVKTLYNRVSKGLSPSRETLSAGLSCLASTDLRAAVGQIRVPTQVIVGKADRVANPRGGEALARAIDGAELVMLEAGHAPFITQANQVVTKLDSLIATVTGAP